ncbi:hypothetical protein [Tropicimonas sp. IMCC6043]|uniref:hypothetical protein n=1 Tax=Tropicimonas sp. IMCC6043 TaxID=2510645 RepID=UPI00101C7A8E|nr:hypothetical protein [Tropicimonas sp. IMCC6043]RYH11637.1 hypothetical protein EU800_03075 [Tropicimonas sp. IMCC6043]
MRLVLVGLLALAACNPLSGSRTSEAEEGTQAFVEQARARCEARGGNFGSGSAGVVNICYVTPKDANQSCSTATDCEGQCLARSRTCAPVIPLIGCHEVLLENGQVAEFCQD